MPYPWESQFYEDAVPPSLGGMAQDWWNTFPWFREGGQFVQNLAGMAGNLARQPLPGLAPSWEARQAGIAARRAPPGVVAGGPQGAAPAGAMRPFDNDLQRLQQAAQAGDQMAYSRILAEIEYEVQQGTQYYSPEEKFQWQIMKDSGVIDNWAALAQGGGGAGGGIGVPGGGGGAGVDQSLGWAQLGQSQRQFEERLAFDREKEKAALREALATLQMQGVGAVQQAGTAAMSGAAQAARYALPAGATYVPGWEPGGPIQRIAEKRGRTYTPQSALTTTVDWGTVPTQTQNAVLKVLAQYAQGGG